MKATPTLPGILTVEATDTVKVSYDAALNLIEIIQGTKVLRSEICPRGYTAAQFVTTLQRVRAYYSKN